MDKELRNGFDKYINNIPLNKEDVWEMLQRELYDLCEIQSLLDVSDPESIKAWHKEEAIRFAMDLIQRME